jgi:hypothetical protein
MQMLLLLVWLPLFHCLALQPNSPLPLSYTATASPCLSKKGAQFVLDHQLLPVSQYGNRISLGLQSQGLPIGRIALDAHDPVLSETYGEFPLPSLDTLLDRAVERLTVSTSPNLSSNNPLTVVDLGSGCGRVALYLALSRRNWRVHGIEMSSIYHQAAAEACARAMDLGYLRDTSDQKSQASGCEPPPEPSSTVFLHNGAANQYKDLFHRADLIFCYSTAFDSGGFSEGASALLLGREWSELLASSCRDGCVCITTDKALDPTLGWSILHRIDVPNGEVCGSTGYIQRLLM